MADLSTPSPAPGRNANKRLAMILLLVVGGMLGAAYAAVPLYQFFCQVTGYGGTTRIASANLKGTIARQMTTRFDANISKGLPISVTPARPVSAKIGEAQTIMFLATNQTARELHTTASFNVTPEGAGAYFNKIQCFCFTDQTLEPGETKQMPVTFFIDPDIQNQAELATVTAITLSYTFYDADSERI